MNCIDHFKQNVRTFPDRIAFVGPGHTPVTFANLGQKVASAQSYLKNFNFNHGDSVLIACDISADLYALIVAVLGLGGSVILVEPWMPLKNISDSIEFVKPKFFVSSFLGKLWGGRVRQIRMIPYWISLGNIFVKGNFEIDLIEVDPRLPAIITFTSGTSGKPKGVVREHGYLIRQYEVLKKNLHLDKFHGADLTIFANWTLLNLAQGRTTVYFPAKWNKSYFKWISDHFNLYQIETLTCGPSFMKHLLNNSSNLSFKEIHIGGALIAIDFLKEVMNKNQSAKVYQIYGSSEVEPVCLVDAETSIMRSTQKNFYHSLYIGKPIEEISFELKDNELWVTGPHVCPFYLNNSDDNLTNKKQDRDGRIWHFMGDRITDDDGWFYSGRSQFSSEHFFKEQHLYSFLGHDNAFLVFDENHRFMLFGEDVEKNKDAILKKFDFITSIKNITVKRDKRHRARIDRLSSLK